MFYIKKNNNDWINFFTGRNQKTQTKPSPIALFLKLGSTVLVFCKYLLFIFPQNADGTVESPLTQRWGAKEIFNFFNHHTRSDLNLLANKDWYRESFKL